jgi:uncharacterized YigZ family protein
MRLYGTVLGPGTAEQTIERSRFICYVSPASTREEAEEFFAAIRKKHKDATHNVPAMVIGDKMQIQWASDDGEPQGTSGAPMVQMLVSSGITNVAVVVTRYFGGIKLGTGGLVKAYGNGAKGVLAAADEAGLFEELVAKKDFSFTTDYSLYKLIKNNMELFHISSLTEDFGTEIKITGQIHESEYQVFISKLLDISNGRIKI